MARDILIGFPFAGNFNESGAREVLVGGNYSENESATAYELIAAVGALTLSGTDAQLLRAEDRSFIGGLGFPAMVTETEDLDFLAGLTMVSGATPASLSVLTAERGSFSIGGQNATLSRSNQPTSDLGTFTLSMTAAGLDYGRGIAAGTGTFTYVLAAALPTVEAFAGAFVTAFQPATLTYGSVTATLSAAEADFVVSGSSATLTRGYSLTAEDVSLELFGNIAGALRDYTVAAGSGSFAISGITVSFNDSGATFIASPISAPTFTASPVE